MPKPSCSTCCQLQYLRTPMGAVKVVNIVFGAISLILVGASYVPIWTLGVFIGTVASCLLLSLLYTTVYLFASSSFIHSKRNRVTSFLFHVLAGTALIVAGIELIGWSEYADPSCKHDCPRLYTVGVAKTLTFMNGVLYLIVGFLGMKDDDLLDPESADEHLPLLSSTTVLTNVRGSPTGGPGGGPTKVFYYDRFYHHNKTPYDNSPSSSFRSNFIYRLQRPYNPYTSHTEEYSFNNSYSGAGTFSGVRMIPTDEGTESTASGSTRGHGHVKKPMPHSMPVGNNITEMHFIKE